MHVEENGETCNRDALRDQGEYEPMSNAIRDRRDNHGQSERGSPWRDGEQLGADA